jgi:glycosyltransferase involved in cell wall biosynthesis
MKIPEYMAQGKAVIAPNMKNIRDLIKDGVTGLLFEPNSAESLTKNIETLITKKDEGKRLGGNALLETKEKLNWISNANKIIGLL